MIKIYGSAQERDEAIAELYRDLKFPMAYIVRHTGCSLYEVQKVLRSKGLWSPKDRQALGPIDIDWLKAEVLDRGKTIAQVSRESGRSVRHLKKAILPHLKEEAPLKHGIVDDEELKRLYRDGEMVQALARRYCVGANTVKRHLVEAGVRLRTRAESYKMRHGKLSAEERLRVKKVAWDALKKRGYSPEILAKRNAPRRGRLNSPIQKVVSALMGKAGMRPEPSFMVGVHLVDFAFPESRLAVDLDCGDWPAYSRKAVYLMDKDNALAVSGWRMYRMTVTDDARGVTRAINDIKACLAQGEQKDLGNVDCIAQGAR